MPRSKKVPKAAEVLAPVPDAILNQFAPEGMLTAADVEAATRRFKKALLERALGAELGHHLAQAGDTPDADAPANHRNGSSAKTVRTDDGALPLAIPRDRHGTCAPVLIPQSRNPAIPQSRNPILNQQSNNPDPQSSILHPQFHRPASLPIAARPQETPTRPPSRR